MSDRRSNDGGTRLSPQTLIVASLASLTAAIVTSTFWQRGTPITAAITPVIVALASELYSRPAKRITQLSARAGSVRARQLSDQRERVSTGAPGRSRRPEALRPPEEPELGPMRIYRSEQRSSPIRRLHIRIALITALIAFVIAAAVLTLPELVLGGSVASHGKTTLFGGHRHKGKSKDSSPSTQTAPTTSAPSPTTTTPAPSTTTPVVPPAQTVPQTTTPSPQQAPPPSGTPPAPAPTPTTPAPSG